MTSQNPQPMTINVTSSGSRASAVQLQRDSGRRPMLRKAPPRARLLQHTKKETPYTPVTLASWMRGNCRHWLTPRGAQGNPLKRWERRYSRATQARARVTSCEALKGQGCRA